MTSTNPPQTTVFITGHIRGRLRHPAATTGTHVQVRAILAEEEPLTAHGPGSRSSTIRAWARQRGMSVGSRGNLPADIVAAYAAERTNTDSTNPDRTTAVAS